MSKKLLLTLVALNVLAQAPMLYANTDKVDKLQGAVLPFSVMRNDIPNGAKAGTMLEIRNGGYGSDMTAHPSMANHFFALTDRGPNASFTSNTFGKGKIFPTPAYTPRIGLFKVGAAGEVLLLKEILLKRPDGSPITGLPNNADMGGTGETPFNIDGTPIVMDANKPFDKLTNPLKLDNFGLDGEGLVALTDGSFWVSDEYGPHIVHFDKDGVEIDRINAFSQDARTKYNLPAEFANRRPNRGMEGLAITPDERTLIGTMQSTMYNPNKSVKKLNLVRLVTIDLENGKTGQYLYRQEKAQNSNSGIAALTSTEFVVIERDGSFLRDNPNAMKRLYRIDLSNATNLESIPLSDGLKQDPLLGLTINGETLEQAVLNHGWELLDTFNIKAVKKSLIADLTQRIGYAHDKLEGIWLINPTTIGVLNDDDFATWSNKGKLQQKYLDKNQTVIDTNTLYIIDTKQK